MSLGLSSSQCNIRNNRNIRIYLPEPLHPLPELLTRIKIDLKRLFVTVIDHTTGPDHQLLFFKERFLAKDHPDRAKMARFAVKLRKLGLREETIGYGPTKEKWEAWNADPM